MNIHHLRAMNLLDSEFTRPKGLLVADEVARPQSHVFVLCGDTWWSALYLHNMECFVHVRPSSIVDMDERIAELGLPVSGYAFEEHT
jgi:hypothetical protein